MAHPLIPSKNVRWGLDKFLNWYGLWQNWGGGCELADNRETFDALSSSIIDQLLDIAPRESYTVTTDEFRPDLVSYNIFGHTMYWQIIMLYNGIIAAEDLKAGTVLRYPSLQSLENLLLSNRSKSSIAAAEAISNIPTVSTSRTIRYNTDGYVHDGAHEYSEQIEGTTYRLDDGSVVS